MESDSFWKNRRICVIGESVFFGKFPSEGLQRDRIHRIIGPAQFIWGRNRLNGQSPRWLDIRKVEKLLGIKATIDLVERLHRTIEWHR